MNEDDLLALAAEHGGIRSRGKDPRTLTTKQPLYPEDPSLGMQDVPNPNPTWIITFGDGSTLHVVGERDDNNQPTGNLVQIEGGTLRRDPTGRAAAPATVSGGPAGVLIWNPATNRYEAIGGTQPRDPGQTPTNVNGVFYQLDPATGRMVAIGSDPGTIARQQAADDRAAAAEQRAATKDQAQAEIDRINALRQAKQIDDAEADRQWQRWWKENVEAPMEREKLNLQLQTEERNTATAVQSAGERAGQAAVNDAAARSPYTYSNRFLQGRQAMLEAGQRGTYGPATAVGTINLPDPAAVRAQAQQQGQQSVAAQLGFTLPPAADAFNGVPPYSGPVANPVLPTPEEDAALWAQRLAAAKQRVAGARVQY